MNTTINVSLGGYSFTLDESAYSTLQTYLDEVKIKLGNDTAAQETVNDIEFRIAELLSEKITLGQVVTSDMVMPIIEQIGKPEDIGDDGNTMSKKQYRSKRLYRNPDDSIIAGVCGGLAAYFRVDPLVFRILFIAFLFLKGFGLLLYILLWIAMPKAKTPFQKMEMMGDAENIDEIGRRVRKEISNASDNLKKSKAGNTVNKLINLFVQVLLYLVKAMLVIVKVISITIGILLIVSMLLIFIALVGAVFFASYSPDFSGVIGGVGITLNQIIAAVLDISSSYWITIPLFLTLAIPIVALIYAGIRILFRFRAKDGTIGIIAAVIWAAAVVTLSLTFFFQIRGLSVSEKVVKEFEISPVNSNSKVVMCKSYNYLTDSTWVEETVQIFDWKVFTLKGEHHLAGSPTLIIEKSFEAKPRLEVIRRARGVNSYTAEKNAKDIIYSITLNDTLAILDPLYIIPEKTKWKNQSVTVKLYLPEGYGVHLDETLTDILAKYQPYSNYWPDEMVGKTWIMTANGLRIAR
ncbi:MAG TPA: PspC domain-containing protein [Bacteroidales bacterium]|nr:PspC domain-containing protein [Bacteroidales bacterium]